MHYAALAIRNVEFHAGRVFVPEAIHQMRPSLQPMAWPWWYVSREAAQHGVQLITADQVLDPRGVSLIAYDWSPHAANLVARGARPAVLMSLEPPVIAWWLYTNIPRLSQRFEHVFLFEGARERVAPVATFHPLNFPHTCPPAQPERLDWSQRRFLVMVNSNKALASPRDLARWFDRPREVSLKRLLAGLRYPPVVADRYLERVRAIAALAHLPDFDLYGEGWSHRHPAIRPEQHALVQRVHRGTVPDKHSLLGGYKFALVIENTRFPGYVSEKLFDCFFAGCIPVYDGAPDIDRLVRTDAFIDARRFRSYAQLERCLRNVTEMEAGELLNAGRAYIRSPAFQPFCAKNFAREIVEAVLS